MNDAPQLLIHWSSRWEEFIAALGPALRPSPPRLKLEARAGLFPIRGMILSLLLELMALATAIAHPARLVDQPIARAVTQAREVIYFSADELPRTEDVGGSAAGLHGARGGAAQHHPTQMIRVARGESMREKVTDAPHLNLPKSDSQISNLLAYKEEPLPGPPPSPVKPRIVPAAPVMNDTLSRRAQPELAIAVVPPRPEVEATRARTNPTPLSGVAVAPPPVSLPQRHLARRALAELSVAPPPVAAPPEARSRPAQLVLPAATVVAPAPEIDGTFRSRRSLANAVPRVVAPPVEIGELPRPMHSLGNTTVAPPVPEVNSALQSRRVLSDTAPRVVAPPAELNTALRGIRSLGAASVAPPRPEVPTVELASNRAHDLGIVAAQPPGVSGSAGASSKAGVIVSAKPGDQPATPAQSEKGTLAMSPVGSANAGAGGEGSGKGISRGTGAGSSAALNGSGAAAAGSGKSTVVIARNTNSPYPGPGGAGAMNSGASRVPGVSISGGKNVVTLPSFGATPDAATLAHSTQPKSLGNGITVVASPRAGGALNLYGALKGDRVYTIYISTNAGTAVMQFADPLSVGHPSPEQLVAPRALRAQTPAAWGADHHSRLLIACELDRSGVVRNAHVLQSDDTASAQQMVKALENWKFAPAFRGNEPVDVDAILGFGVDTK